MRPREFLRLALAGLVLAPLLRAWDHPGHSIVNQIALSSLPADFPAFVRDPANVARIEFLSGEPDRWSHAPELPIHHYNWPDHYFDLEQIGWAGLDLNTLPSFRYVFTAQFAVARAAHAAAFPPIEADKNADHTRELCGFLPWTVAEQYGMLKTAFASLKAYEEFGTPEEIANARADVVYTMGIMGHYVGDSAQPLHATVHHAGWTGDNPHGYTTWPKIHSWIDGGLIRKSNIVYADLASRVTPAAMLPLTSRPDGRDPVFVTSLEFIMAQNKLVEPLYQMEKAGKLGNQDPAKPVSAEGRRFVEDQLLKGGEMLGSLWLAAWRTSAPDSYLHSVLQLRHQPATAKTQP
ncbi:MAG TPA: hypothetical protein VG936_03670 [Lacunisphaera sp.]|nr:hypothetical protein [Lacunisphaera sp.]